MKFFSLLYGDKVHLAPGKKIIPAEEYSTLVSAKEILDKVHQESAEYKRELALEAEKIRKEASEKGFEEGQAKWNKQLAALENEITKVKKEMESSLVPLAMAAVKKIIGREVELKPETVVEMIATSLKPVSHHKRVTIYVNKNDLEIVEKSRPQLKALFDHLQSLTITSREDVAPQGCIIETEAGIINASLESQFNALESAFQSMIKNRETKA